MHRIQKQIIKLGEQGISIPSLRMLGKLIGEDHPQNIKHHLGQLDQKNILRYDPRSHRLIILDPKQSSNNDLLSVPIYGAANCGEALKFADDNIDGYLKISKNILVRTKNIFIIEASGDSMNKADINGNNIENGDYVVVDSEYKVPKNTDYIVSIIDGLANIKKFYEDKENSQIVLMPESTKKYSPIFIGIDEIDKYTICGKVIQVIKKPRK